MCVRDCIIFGEWLWQEHYKKLGGKTRNTASLLIQYPAFWNFLMISPVSAITICVRECLVWARFYVFSFFLFFETRYSPSRDFFCAPIPWDNSNQNNFDQCTVLIGVLGHRLCTMLWLFMSKESMLPFSQWFFHLHFRIRLYLAALVAFFTFIFGIYGWKLCPHLVKLPFCIIWKYIFDESLNICRQ